MLKVLSSFLTCVIFLSSQSFTRASTRPRCFKNGIEGVCMRASQCSRQPGYNVIALRNEICTDGEKCCLPNGPKLHRIKTSTQPKRTELKSGKRVDHIFVSPHKVDTRKKQVAEFLTDQLISGIVALEYQKNSTSEPEVRCGGSLIHSRFVLTAAHCVTGEYRNICGDLQSVRVYRGYQRQSIIIKDIILHPNYVVNETGENKFHNDIALIELYSEGTLAEEAQPVFLPTVKYKLKMSMHFTVFGWGLTENGTASEILQMLEQPLFDHSACKNIYSHNHVVSESQICAGGVEGEGTCDGDSGGPLMRVEWGGILVIEGIVSWSRDKCGLPGVPTVYTKVRSFVPWIVDTMRHSFTTMPIVR